MNFSRPDIARKAAKACAASKARRNARRAHLGNDVAVSFHVPRLHMDTIQQAADMDHRTMSNFIYHAAVIAAERMVKGAGQ